MTNINLILRYASAHFEQTNVTVKKGDKLTINLIDNGLTKGKVLLYLNGKAFVFKDKKVVVPEQCLRAVNTVLVQDKTPNGAIYKEWRNNEKLCLDLERLDLDGEKRLLAEREQHQKMVEQYNQMKEAYNKLHEQHQKDYAEWQQQRQTLASEILKLAKKVNEIALTVDAIKNEPIV